MVVTTTKSTPLRRRSHGSPSPKGRGWYLGSDVPLVPTFHRSTSGAPKSFSFFGAISPASLPTGQPNADRQAEPCKLRGRLHHPFVCHPSCEFRRRLIR